MAKRYLPWERLEDIPFSSRRVRRAFMAAGLKTVGDVVKLGQRGLKQLPNFGRVTMEEVRKTLNLPLISEMEYDPSTLFAICAYTENGRMIRRHHTPREALAADAREIMESLDAAKIVIRSTDEREYLEIVRRG